MTLHNGLLNSKKTGKGRIKRTIERTMKGQKKTGKVQDIGQEIFSGLISVFTKTEKDRKGTERRGAEDREPRAVLNRGDFIFSVDSDKHNVIKDLNQR